MSDFLTRLAERALGLAPKVRPRLAPRFAPDPDPLAAARGEGDPLPLPPRLAARQLGAGEAGEGAGTEGGTGETAPASRVEAPGSEGTPAEWEASPPGAPEDLALEADRGLAVERRPAHGEGAARGTVAPEAPARPTLSDAGAWRAAEPPAAAEAGARGAGEPVQRQEAPAEGGAEDVGNAAGEELEKRLGKEGLVTGGRAVPRAREATGQRSLAGPGEMAPAPAPGEEAPAHAPDETAETPAAPAFPTQILRSARDDSGDRPRAAESKVVGGRSAAGARGGTAEPSAAGDAAQSVPGEVVQRQAASSGGEAPALETALGEPLGGAQPRLAETAPGRSPSGSLPMRPEISSREASGGSPAVRHEATPGETLGGAQPAPLATVSDEPLGDVSPAHSRTASRAASGGSPPSSPESAPGGPSSAPAGLSSQDDDATSQDQGAPGWRSLQPDALNREALGRDAQGAPIQRDRGELPPSHPERSEGSGRGAADEASSQPPILRTAQGDAGEPNAAVDTAPRASGDAATSAGGPGTDAGDVAHGIGQAVQRQVAPASTEVARTPQTAFGDGLPAPRVDRNLEAERRDPLALGPTASEGLEARPTPRFTREDFATPPDTAVAVDQATSERRGADRSAAPSTPAAERIELPLGHALRGSGAEREAVPELRSPSVVPETAMDRTRSHGEPAAGAEPAQRRSGQVVQRQAAPPGASSARASQTRSSEGPGGPPPALAEPSSETARTETTPQEAEHGIEGSRGTNPRPLESLKAGSPSPAGAISGSAGEAVRSGIGEATRRGIDEAAQRELGGVAQRATGEVEQRETGERESRGIGERESADAAPREMGVAGQPGIGAAIQRRPADLSMAPPATAPGEIRGEWPEETAGLRYEMDRADFPSRHPERSDGSGRGARDGSRPPRTAEEGEARPSRAPAEDGAEPAPGVPAQGLEKRLGKEGLLAAERAVPVETRLPGRMDGKGEERMPETARDREAPPSPTRILRSAQDDTAGASTAGTEAARDAAWRGAGEAVQRGAGEAVQRGAGEAVQRQVASPQGTSAARAENAAPSDELGVSPPPPARASEGRRSELPPRRHPGRQEGSGAPAEGGAEPVPNALDEGLEKRPGKEGPRTAGRTVPVEPLLPGRTADERRAFGEARGGETAGEPVQRREAETRKLREETASAARERMDRTTPPAREAPPTHPILHSAQDDLKWAESAPPLPRAAKDEEAPAREDLRPVRRAEESGEQFEERTGPPPVLPRAPTDLPPRGEGREAILRGDSAQEAPFTLEGSSAREKRSPSESETGAALAAAPPRRPASTGSEISARSVPAGPTGRAPVIQRTAAPAAHEIAAVPLTGDFAPSAEPTSLPPGRGEVGTGERPGGGRFDERSGPPPVLRGEGREASRYGESIQEPTFALESKGGATPAAAVPARSSDRPAAAQRSSLPSASSPRAAGTDRSGSRTPAPARQEPAPTAQILRSAQDDMAEPKAPAAQAAFATVASAATKIARDPSPAARREDPSPRFQQEHPPLRPEHESSLPPEHESSPPPKHESSPARSRQEAPPAPSARPGAAQPPPSHPDLPPPRTAPETPSRRVQEASAEAAARIPVVHVHIDRIEVRIEEPLAPPRPAPRKPPGTSLDRYLAERRRGR